MLLAQGSGQQYTDYHPLESRAAPSVHRHISELNIQPQSGMYHSVLQSNNEMAKP